MGPESSDPTSMGTSYDFVPLPADSPFLSDHGLGAPEPPPRAQPVEPPSTSQFPPSTQAPSGMSSVASNLAERPRSSSNPPRPPPPPTGSFTILQDGISSFPLYMGADDTNAVRRSGSTSAAIPIGAPVGASKPTEMDLMTRIRGIMITATDSVQGRIVEEYLGPVDAEIVIPLTQFLEGSEPQGKLMRHKVAQHRLRQLQQLLQAELRLEADKLGGNAVLAVSVQMREIQSVLVLSGFGTAVRLA